MTREGRPQAPRSETPEPYPETPEPYPAQKARGGEIILNTPFKRAIFIAGLAGAVLLVFLLGLLR